MRVPAFAVLSVVLSAPAAAGIVINELLPNPAGDDVGTERVEIYNDGTDPIDVTGWAIDDAATIDDVSVRARLPEDFDTSACSSSPVIGPGEFRLVKGTSTAAWLNNSGDDVYLISDRTATPTVVDVVTYPSASSEVDNVWACVPDGSLNFDWRAQSLCGSNGGSGNATAPDAITDLGAGPGAFPGEIVLTWTATGDDGSAGTASEYVIKVSDAPIDAGSFAAATDLDFWLHEPLPQEAGTPESLVVSGFDPAETYFFAITAVDDALNESPVSNSPGTMPAPGTLLDTDFGLSTYFGNLHSHTGYSDGEDAPADAYEYARYDAQTPLDFLAVTDHNHSGAGPMSPALYQAGLAAAAAANEDGGFVAIYGQEFGLSGNGHANVFESPVLFGWEGGNYDVFVAEGDYAALYTAAVSNPPAVGPPLILWCHPQSGDFDGLAVTADSPSVVKLICLVNGPAFSTVQDESDVGNTGFDDTFQDALRLGHRVSPTGDQDNHNANWGASTESRTAVLASELTKSAILEALHDGHNYATQDHDVVVGLSADGHMMGEAFVRSSGIRLAVEVSDPDPGDGVDLIELYRGVTGASNATRVAFNVGNTRFDWRETESFDPGTEVHYYARIRQSDTQLIWTAPVYVTYDAALATSDPDHGPAARPLLAVHPNPTAGGTSVQFTLPDDDRIVSLDVLDVSGRRIRRLVGGALPRGAYGVDWDGRTRSGTPVSPGIYFVRLASSDGHTATQRVTVLR